MSPSPFLPGTNIQFAVDSTSIGLLKTCARLYWLTMIEGYQSPDEAIHLRFGIEVHSALEAFDKARAKGETFDDALRTTISGLITRTAEWNPDRETKAGKYKNRDTLFGCVVDYLDHYRHDPAKTFILKDGSPAVELSFSFELDFGPTAEQPYLLCGHLDRVVDFSGDLFVMDRKTTVSTPGSYYFDQYSPNNQMSLYTIAGKVVLSSPIRGVIIDAIQVKLTEPAGLQRGFTYRTEEQMSEWLEDLRSHLAVARAYAEADYWPQNDTSCDKFGGCKFREVCASSPNVRDVYLRKFKKLERDQRWNPLKNR